MQMQFTPSCRLARRENPSGPFSLAASAAAARYMDQAMAHAQEAFTSREPNLISARSFASKHLRQDPRFTRSSSCTNGLAVSNRFVELGNLLFISVLAQGLWQNRGLADSFPAPLTLMKTRDRKPLLKRAISLWHSAPSLSRNRLPGRLWLFRSRATRAERSTIWRRRFPPRKSKIVALPPFLPRSTPSVPIRDTRLWSRVWACRSRSMSVASPRHRARFYSSGLDRPSVLRKHPVHSLPFGRPWPTLDDCSGDLSPA